MISARGEAEPAARIDRTLVRAVCLARAWAASLAAGEVASTKDLARQSGLCPRYAARMMPLAWLAPDLLAAIMDGRQPRAISLGALMRSPLPTDWDDHRRLFEAIG